MRTIWLILFCFCLMAIAGPALAQGVNPYNVSWAALNPGNDWAAQVVRSIFPIPGGNPGQPTGNEATVIQQIVGQFTGFVGAIACAFVAYTVIMNIHRAAETSRILGQGQTWMFVVRVGFAGIMMFPLGGGFSAGQGLVMQSAMVGVGMAKALYQNAMQAVGPDAIVIAQPMIPGTSEVVGGLVESELCMDLVNLASNTIGSKNGPLVPIPAALTLPDSTGGGSVTYQYQMSPGNGWGNPVCGTVKVDATQKNPQTISGVNVDMATVQAAVLSDILNGSIRNQVATVAQQLWLTKQASALTPLQAVYTSAVNAYTSELTSAATNLRSSINAALAANAQAYRSGSSDLLQNEVTQSTIGWAGAGAYYLEIAKLNASTLSLLNNTPVVTPPSWQGLGRSLTLDLAPMQAAENGFMTTLNYVTQTTDNASTPCGTPQTLADDKVTKTDQQLLTSLFCSMHLTNWTLQTITNYMTPGSQIWSDPFSGLMSMGQTLINSSLIAMAAAALASSGIVSWGSAVLEFFTGNVGGAAATVAGHAVMSFLGTPIFLGLLSILVPGLTIAYVLPMIPWVIWMAGVAGWIILVCEAMVAVPLWMLAHMTIGGDGLHGRAIEGWGLLFNVVFRPTLMIIGLFLGYFVFDCMSWLIRESFGIAAGFVLQHGWIVSNFLGLVVLLSIFVMTHVVAALMSFRMVALLPHHLPRLIGFSSANRVDMDDFQQRAAWGPGTMMAGSTSKALSEGTRSFQDSTNQLRGGPSGYISGPGKPTGGDGGGGMDSTLRSSTDSTPQSEDDQNV